MSDRNRELPPELEAQWRDWASTEPSIDEQQLKRNLLQRIPERKTRTRSRLVLVAAAASLLTVFIGIELIRQPRVADIVIEPAVAHELAGNMILILQEDGDPIYVLMDPPGQGPGGQK